MASRPTLSSSWTARTGFATTLSLTPGFNISAVCVKECDYDADYQPQGWLEHGGGGEIGGCLQVDILNSGSLPQWQLNLSQGH